METLGEAYVLDLKCRKGNYILATISTHALNQKFKELVLSAIISNLSLPGFE